MKRQVVVTGMGVISPIGNDIEAFSRALFAGRSGAGLITRFNASRLPTRFAAEVKGLDPEHRDIKIDFALAAAGQALSAASGEKKSLAGYRAALSIGIGLELFSLDDLAAAREPGFSLPDDAFERLTFLNTPADLCVQLLAQRYGFNRPPLISISACAASTDAIGAAFEAIREDRLDIALAGGTDSMINPMGVAGFCRIGALSRRNDTPRAASRPFDRDRDGFLLGEGAGFLLLEADEIARRRGTAALARISGYGNSLDAHSVSDPDPQGRGALAAMRAALASAELPAAAISAINAHGTGTAKNDPAESRAIRSLLGARTEEVPVQATKSMLGHMISAAGAVETIAAIECIRRGMLHVTSNLERVDEHCRLRHVTGKPLAWPLQHVLKNSFAFGGQNACLIVSAPDT